MKQSALALLALTLLAPSAASAAPAACADLRGDGSFLSCAPNPNTHFSCGTLGPTWIETAQAGGQTAACPGNGIDAPFDALDSRVRDIYVQSDAMNEEVFVRLILPPGYDTDPVGTTYPVLLLLTGRGASYQSWSCNTLVQNYVQDAKVIVAMPDGSRRYNRCVRPENISQNAIPGWYSDWNSPSSDGNATQWETFHTEELLDLLQDEFKASERVAVAGLSMGGFGAIKYAARNPKFVAAASYSGLLDTVSSEGFTAVTGSLTLAGQDTNAPWSYYPGTPYANMWGTLWPDHNPKQLVNEFVVPGSSNLRIPLFVSVGDGSMGKLLTSYNAANGALEAAAKPTNQRFVSALKTANGGVTPPNLTVEYYQGTHQWRYWDTQFCRSLSVLMPALLQTTSFTPGLPCNNR